MPFTWTNSATGKIVGDDKSTSILKEIKTNIQNLYTSLSLGTATYTGDMSDNFIRGSNITELRGKIDAIHDNRNKCLTVYSAVNAVENATKNTTYYSTKHTGYNSDYDSGYDGSYDSNDDGSDYGSYYSGDDGSYDSSEYGDYNGSYRAPVD